MNIPVISSYSQWLIDAPESILLLLKMTMLLGLGWILHSLFKNLNPRWRVVLWRSVAVGLVILPVWTFTGWNFSIPVTGLPQKVSTTPTTLKSESPRKSEQTQKPVVFVPAYDNVNDLKMNRSGVSSTEPPPQPTIERKIAIAPTNGTENQSGFFGWFLIILWGAGCLASLSRLVIGHIRISQLIQNTKEVPESVKNVFSQVCKELNFSGDIPLKQSDQIQSPFLFGFRKTVLYLPEFLCDEEQQADLPAVFAHEISHLKSSDLQWHLWMNLQSAILWFHPLCWKIKKAHLCSCELASDNTSASYVGNSNDYSRTLAKVATRIFSTTPDSALAMARVSQITHRLDALQKKIFDSSLKKQLVFGFAVLSLILSSSVASFQFVYAENSPEKKTEISAKEKKTETNKSKSDQKEAGQQNKKTVSNENKPKEIEEEKISVKGIVVDEAGNPVEGVPVTLRFGITYNKETFKTETDSAGEFEFSNTPTYLQGMNIRAFTEDKNFIAEHGPIYEKSEIGKESLTLKLKPSQRAEFVIVDQDDKPIVNNLVELSDSTNFQDHAMTDSEGKVVFHFSKENPPLYICSKKEGVGLDYKAYVLPRKLRGNPTIKRPEIPSDPITLKLDGIQPIIVRVVGENNEPVEGIDVRPWYVQKKGEPDHLNFAFFRNGITAKTDAKGYARFNWIPAWQESNFIFWASGTGYTYKRAEYNPQVNFGNLTIQIEKLVPMRGRVTMPDGSPAENIMVSVTGENHEMDNFRRGVKTDSNGNYEMMVNPNMIYLVTVFDQKFGSDPHTGFAVMPDQPVDHIDFKLRPATRIFGKVTEGPNQNPIPDQSIVIYQYGRSLGELPDIKLPNPKERNFVVRPTITFHTKTDQNGNFELFTGSGKFDIRGPTQSKVPEYEITNESEKEFNFHIDYPVKGTLEGVILDAETRKPIAGVRVEGVHQNHMARRDLVTLTDKDGKFKVERELHKTFLFAKSKDEKLAGTLEIGPDDKNITILVKPISSAVGKVIEEETGQPLANKEIIYNVEIPLNEEKTIYAPRFGGKTNTDENGRFQINSLAVGQIYDIKVTLKHNSEGHGTLWKMVGQVTPESSEQVDLGTLILKPEYKPPTLKERTEQAFDLKKERGTPLERFEKAKENAQLARQNILVIFGNPESQNILDLMKLRYKDSEFGREFFPYQLLAFSTEKNEIEAARALAKKMRVSPELLEKDSLIAITDENGILLSTYPNQSFEKKPFAQYLQTHAPDALDAKNLLEDALTKAKEQNKRVIIQETATWCGPCWALSRFLEKEKQLWEKDFILVKMDLRWKHAEKIMNEYRGDAQGGIPWWAILDSEGKILITSNTSEGTNIGFPVTEEEVAHFQKMFLETSNRLSEEELDQFFTALKKAGESYR